MWKEEVRLVRYDASQIINSDSAKYAAEYRLPFDGRWFVMAGGDTINVNHHMVERSQWFGVDFMKTGGPTDRSVAKGDRKSLDDY
jgi:hypothetical protein